MIAFSLLIYYTKGNFENELSNVTYALYLFGILWALYGFRQSAKYPKSFKNYFTEGFKCFIVVTLLMVLFTFLFSKFNVQLRNEMMANARKELLNDSNKTPQEVEKLMHDTRRYYAVMLTSIAIFGYLLIGAVVTLIGSLLFSQFSKTDSTQEEQAS